MIIIRPPETIYQAGGRIQNGTFRGRWHFSFDEYYDPEFIRFGTLRVFNDDTLSPGAIWPLHPHKDNEVVTYCVEGEFRHADDRGAGGILKPGWVQHTTVGKGMWHSEINNNPGIPMRFVQMWFLPAERGLEPSVEQKPVEKAERENKLLPVVSNLHAGALPIKSDAQVYSGFLRRGGTVTHAAAGGRGIYLALLQGGPVVINGQSIPGLGAAMITLERELRISAQDDAEFLLVDVLL